jgi:N-formylglutamate amidohydrolase
MTVGDRPPRRDLDLFTDRLWNDAPAAGATVVISKVSRYVIDLNRAADDVSGAAVAGAKPNNDPGYYRERGVIWRTATDGTPVMARPLTREGFDRRIATFWQPYHDALAAEIERVRQIFGFCILVDGHSMPSLGGGKVRQNRRADVVPGDLDGRSCDTSITRAVAHHFRESGYSVRANDPYKGGWITRHYGNPARSVHAIQIEVNRDLYMDEKTFRADIKGLKRLAEACGGLIPTLARLEL